MMEIYELEVVRVGCILKHDEEMMVILQDLLWIRSWRMLAQLKPIKKCLFRRFFTELGELLYINVKKCMKDAGMSKKTAKKSRAVKDDGRQDTSRLA